MHSYSIDSGEHREVLLKLLVPIVFLTIGMHYAVDWISATLEVQSPIWIQSFVSLVGVGGALKLVMDWIDGDGWRRGAVRRLLGIKTPDMNGDWKVTGESSYEAISGQRATWSARASIQQSWSQILISIDTEESNSKSTIATIRLKERPGRPSLEYVYENRPRRHSKDSMRQHFGFASLEMSPPEEPRYLNGEYFNDPQFRQSYGEMTLSEVEKEA